MGKKTKYYQIIIRKLKLMVFMHMTIVFVSHATYKL